MKFKVTFKTPDAVMYAARDRATDEEGLSEPDVDQLADELAAFASRWVGNGEYITVEFDMDAETATVVPRAQ